MNPSIRIGRPDGCAGGRLLQIDRPQVMGIVNVTPDSFYADSRTPVDAGRDVLMKRVRSMVDDGATILDVGAVSTRPGSVPASEDEEFMRLDMALTALREALPEAIVSVDTFRASVARHVVRNFGVAIVNDISGLADPDMLAAVAETGAAYVLTHNVAGGEAPVDVRVAQFFASRLEELYGAGVADVILDPGFGFAKTLDENYALMSALPRLVKLFPQVPFLVGISRKSMIYRLLGLSPENALNGTTVLNTIALQAGVHILRVHDVREAAEAVRIVDKLTD